MQQPKTIIELDYKLDSDQEEKLKGLLEILFNKDKETSIEIHDSKYYTFESEFAKVIVEEFLENEASNI